MPLGLANQSAVSGTETETSADEPGWPEAFALFRRTQPFCWPLVLLFLIIPFYMIIGWEYSPYVPQHAPTTRLDALLSLSPAWAPVYTSLFLAALLPAFVLHDTALFRRTVIAYIIAWLVAYAVFLGWPTVCPRPARLQGDEFFTWLLRNVYDTDHRFNCFPSLHVAQCYIAALACRFVHRRLGDWLLVWATLVALSTVFTKQHYVADAICGAALGVASIFIAFRHFDTAVISPQLRVLAPRLAGSAFAAYGLLLVALGVAYISR